MNANAKTFYPIPNWEDIVEFIINRYNVSSKIKNDKYYDNVYTYYEIAIKECYVYRCAKQIIRECYKKRIRFSNKISYITSWNINEYNNQNEHKLILTINNIPLVLFTII
jgi:hypothetical protein